VNILKQTSIATSEKLEELGRLCQSRADAYTLLSRIWGSEVDEFLFEKLRRTPLPHLSHQPKMDQAYRRLEGDLKQDGPETLTALAIDYARLCLGSDPRQGADPYESVHRNKEGLMMHDDWEAVLRLYTELGLRKTEDVHETEDHLAMELECMALLCTRQETALRAGNLPEASWWQEQQARMLDEHLLRWVPSFVRRVDKLGRTEFYKAFGALTEEFLNMDREVLAVPVMEI